MTSIFGTPESAGIDPADAQKITDNESKTQNISLATDTTKTLMTQDLIVGTVSGASADQMTQIAGTTSRFTSGLNRTYGIQFTLAESIEVTEISMLKDLWVAPRTAKAFGFWNTDTQATLGSITLGESDFTDDGLYLRHTLTTPIVLAIGNISWGAQMVASVDRNDLQVATAIDTALFTDRKIVATTVSSATLDFPNSVVTGVTLQGGFGNFAYRNVLGNLDSDITTRGLYAETLTLTGLASGIDPVSAGDLATKSYVDASGGITRSITLVEMPPCLGRVAIVDGEIMAYGVGFAAGVWHLPFGSSFDSSPAFHLVGVVDPPPSWAKVLATQLNIMALGSDGRVFMCGESTGGALGNTVTTYDADGRIPLDPITTFPALTVITDIWCSTAEHTTNVLTGTFFALSDAGILYSWGLGSSGQLGNGSTTAVQRDPVVVTLSNLAANDVITKIVVGGLANAHALMMTTDSVSGEKRLYAWGENADGQLGDGTTTDRSVPFRIQIAAADIENCEDVVISSGSGTTGITRILRGNPGTTWACGNNSSGALADLTTVNKSVFTQESSGATDVVKIFLGGISTDASTAYINSSGQVYVAGYNFTGQLGMGNNGNYSAFVLPTGSFQTFADTVKFSATGGAAGRGTIQTTTGTLWATGEGTSGVLGGGNFTTVNTFQQVLIDSAQYTVADHAHVGEGSNVSMIIRTTEGKMLGCGFQSYSGLNLSGLVSTPWNVPLPDDGNVGPAGAVGPTGAAGISSLQPLRFMMDVTPSINEYLSVIGEISSTTLDGRNDHAVGVAGTYTTLTWRVSGAATISLEYYIDGVSGGTITSVGGTIRGSKAVSITVAVGQTVALMCLGTPTGWSYSNFTLS